MKKTPLVYIIVLNYNGYRDTIECIESLKYISYNNYRIIIVDNYSTDGSEKVLKEKFCDCIFLQTGRNLGYAGGNNIAIEYALVNNAEYICILNNDVIVTVDFLSELVEYSEQNQDVAMVGPMICEYADDRIIQSTGAMVDLYRGKIPLINCGKTEEYITEKIVKCDFVGGACILVRKSVVDQIGLIPENYFLFFEEAEWCLKAKKIGYAIICNCNAKVKHKGSVSIKKVPGLNEYFINRNKIVFEKRNAKFIQLCLFYLYVIMQTTYRIILKKENFKIVKYYIDGALGRVNRKYAFVYINNLKANSKI